MSSEIARAILEAYDTQEEIRIQVKLTLAVSSLSGCFLVKLATLYSWHACICGTWLTNSRTSILFIPLSASALLGFKSFNLELVTVTTLKKSRTYITMGLVR